MRIWSFKVGDKIKKTYKALLDGAELGLSGQALYRFVTDKYPKATSKRIVKAALLTLSDPDVTSEATLHAIYALAIKHRLDPATAEDGDDDAVAFAKAPSASAIQDDHSVQLLDATDDA